MEQLLVNRQFLPILATVNFGQPSVLANRQFWPIAATVKKHDFIIDFHYDKLNFDFMVNLWENFDFIMIQKHYLEIYFRKTVFG